MESFKQKKMYREEGKNSELAVFRHAVICSFLFLKNFFNISLVFFLSTVENRVYVWYTISGLYSNKVYKFTWLLRVTTWISLIYSYFLWN